ncbi:MAG: AraC family transcriptional regulator [Capsulimonadaceae bacterium]|nr:AraC family transcriptional regulator [Capsulimonadaceae bacterium]
MQLMHLPSLLAGFHGEAPDPAVPELHRAGEEWLPGNQGISAHSHDDWELYLQVDGVSHWEGDDRRIVLSPGALFLPQPGATHVLIGDRRERHHFIFAGIDIDTVLARMPELAPAWRQNAIVVQENAGSLLAPFRLLVREVALKQPFRSAGLRAALDAVVIEASRLIAPRENPTLFMPSHQAVARAKTLIETQPHLAWKLSDLAQASGISPSRLMQLFTQEVGIPPRQLLLQVRIARATEMLQTTDTPITGIAMDLGFASSQHFAVVFRRHAGETATAFRARTRRAREGRGP